LGFLSAGHRQFVSADFEDGASGISGLEQAMQALEARRSRPCDVLRLTHKDGAIYYTNLLSVRFYGGRGGAAASAVSGAGAVRVSAIYFLTSGATRSAAVSGAIGGSAEFDSRRCLFLTFNNSKFTGGTMMIAPDAVTDDGLIEYVRWGPIGRLGLIRNLATLYDGTHTRHPLAERQAVRKVEFQLDGPVDVMVDGEVLTLECQTIEVLPAALRVVFEGRSSNR